MTTEAITEEVKTRGRWVGAVQDELAHVIVGQKYLIDRLIIGLLVLMGGLGGMTGSATQAASATVSSPAATAVQRAAPVQPAALPPSAPIVVQAKKFGDEYEANQIAAEHKWAGQFVQFTAPVGNINSSGVSFTDVTSKFSFTQISCRVSDETQLIPLVKGKSATVRGVVSDDQLMGVISLNECEVVE